jgi:hypothetical protein
MVTLCFLGGAPRVAMVRCLESCRCKCNEWDILVAGQRWCDKECLNVANVLTNRLRDTVRSGENSRSVGRGTKKDISVKQVRPGISRFEVWVYSGRHEDRNVDIRGWR